MLRFVYALRRLRYGTVGLLQYLAPTLQFATAVVAFSKPFDQHRLITFALIWAGLALKAPPEKPLTSRAEAS